jgi:hypothetical protein
MRALAQKYGDKRMSKIVHVAIGGVLTVIALAVLSNWLRVANPPVVPLTNDPAMKSLATSESEAINHESALPVDTTMELRQRAQNQDRWPLGTSGRLPGVTSSLLGNSIETWILSLPIAKQDAARRFADRYAPAYEIRDKSVQAWMLDNGFPSLEEFAAFDLERHTNGCGPLECRNPKIAALASDHYIDQMEKILPAAVMKSKTNVELSTYLDASQMQNMIGDYVAAASYIDRVRDGGNVIFAAYLRGRLEQAIGHADQAAASRLFIAACGDQRMNLEASSFAYLSVVTSMSYGSPCNFGHGRPLFPEPQLVVGQAGY